MKIILLAANITQFGGIERLISVLANRFVLNPDYSVEIINVGKKNGIEKFNLDKNINCNYIGIEEESLEGRSILYKIKYNFKLFFKIKSYFKNYNFDSNKNIIIAFGHNFSCMLPFLVKSTDKVKLIGSQHNPINYKFIYSFIRLFALKRLDKYVVLNRTMENDLLEHYKLSNTIVIENPNTLENVKISNLNNKQVIAVGRLTEQKGFDVLIEIWSNIQKKFPGWTLKIYGDGPLKKLLINKIKEKKLEKNIIIEGFVKNITDKYSESDIYVMTSNYEGFGLVLVEAQSCGLPTISFDCPFGPRNIINDGQDGYLVNMGDSNDFQLKLMRLMNDNKLRENYSYNAINNSKRFSVGNISKKWIKIFNELYI